MRRLLRWGPRYVATDGSDATRARNLFFCDLTGTQSCQRWSDVRISRYGCSRHKPNTKVPTSASSPPQVRAQRHFTTVGDHRRPDGPVFADSGCVSGGLRAAPNKPRHQQNWCRYRRSRLPIYELRLSGSLPPCEGESEPMSGALDRWKLGRPETPGRRAGIRFENATPGIPCGSLATGSVTFRKVARRSIRIGGRRPRSGVESLTRLPLGPALPSRR